MVGAIVYAVVRKLLKKSKLGRSESCPMPVGDDSNGPYAIGKVGISDGQPLAYHLQICLRFVVCFLYFVCKFLNRLGLKRASDYFDNLALRFTGVILDIHSRKSFGVSWDESARLRQSDAKTPDASSGERGAYE